MKVIFDVNVPRKLKRLMPGHQITTAQERGWGLLENSDLLQAAESSGFEVMVTADKSTAYQQNLTNRLIAIVVLPRNDWTVLQHSGVQVRAALDDATPNSYLTVNL